MHRFFADKSQFTETKVELFGDDVKHISKVLRLKSGDRISVCDKDNTDYICEITSVDKDSVVASVLEKSKNPNESNLQITLYQGLPKGDKMDLIIQKSVELGVVKIVPVVMKRTVVKLGNTQSKMQRWQRIADEASKQCLRGILPTVAEPISFGEMINELNDDEITVLPYENEDKNKLKTVLKDNSSKNRINIIIGPEGGFDADEVVLATQKGAKSVTLGPRIMRCETAPIATISAVMYELGDW